MNILPDIRTSSEFYGEIVSSVCLPNFVTLTVLCVHVYFLFQAEGLFKGVPLCGVSW